MLENVSSLTIHIEVQGPNIVITCPELDLDGTYDYFDTADTALGDFSGKINDAIVDSCVTGSQPSAFIKRLYGADEEEFEDWFDEKLFERSSKEYRKAFFANYSISEPAIADLLPPSHDLSSGLWDEFHNLAYQGLIDEGKENKHWQLYCSCLFAMKYKELGESDRQEFYQAIVRSGLPVFSQEKMESLSFDDLDDFRFFAFRIES